MNDNGNKIWYILVIPFIVIIVEGVIALTLYKKLTNCREELNAKIELANTLKEENNKLNNDIEKLEVIKNYEIDKVLAASDSTTIELWKQLLEDL